MTFLLGWIDEDGAYLCADSAVSHTSPMMGATSSFGEAQRLDLTAVEERAIKFIELPRGVVVAVSGVVAPAVDFIAAVGRRLATTDLPLPTILQTTGMAEDFEDDFDLLFAHTVDAHPEITIFTSLSHQFTELSNNGYATCGSLPATKATVATRLVTAIRQHGLPPDARLAGALVVLQSMGIRDYLPDHGVGGAFFGVRVSRLGIHWQPDLVYLIYPQAAFADTPIIRPGNTSTPVPSTSEIEKVRVLVRDGAGVVLSSLGEPPTRILLPALSSRTIEEWQELVAQAVPMPTRLVLHSQHVGLLHKEKATVTYIYNPSLTRGGAFAIGERNDQVSIEIAPRLMQSLELTPPNDRFHVRVVTEAADGASGKTYVVRLDGD